MRCSAEKEHSLVLSIRHAPCGQDQKSGIHGDSFRCPLESVLGQTVSKENSAAWCHNAAATLSACGGEDGEQIRLCGEVMIILCGSNLTRRARKERLTCIAEEDVQSFFTAEKVLSKLVYAMQIFEVELLCNNRSLHEAVLFNFRSAKGARSYEQ